MRLPVPPLRHRISYRLPQTTSPSSEKPAAFSGFYPRKHLSGIWKKSMKSKLKQKHVFALIISCTYLLDPSKLSSLSPFSLNDLEPMKLLYVSLLALFITQTTIFAPNPDAIRRPIPRGRTGERLAPRAQQRSQTPRPQDEAYRSSSATSTSRAILSPRTLFGHRRANEASSGFIPLASLDSLDDFEGDLS